jgi:hypothetical protein
MLENCCYGQPELMVLNMVRDGLFGDLLYGEAAYLHDLRRLLFEDRSEGLWRRKPHTERNGNLYPTHGLGPVANYMGINRGDRFDYLVSMSSPQKGLDAWRERFVPKSSPKWKEKYVCGDMNSSLIKTANGLMVTLQHNVVNPHPYDRINLIAGVKGIFRIECMRNGLVPDMDVYDAAAWSATGPLSDMSVAKGSAPVKIPDFTRGRWKEKRGWLA